MQSIHLNIKQWNRLFPFFFLLNEEMQIVALGDSLEKLGHFQLGKKFDDYFVISRPKFSNIGFSELKSSIDKMFFLEIKTAKGHVVLRGQFEFLEDVQQLIFVGSPWFTNLEEVADQAIVQKDFAKHDASLDLLHVLHAKEMAEEDNKVLLHQISKERNNFRHFAIVAEETVNAGILLDNTGKIQWVNRAFQQMNGYQLEDCIGNSIGSLLTGKETNPQTLQFIESKIKENSFFECEILNYPLNGNPYWAKVNGQPILDENAEVLHYFILQEDVTDKKSAVEKIRMAEDRWRFALEGAGAGVWEHDFETNKSFFSELYVNLLGYTKQELENMDDVWKSILHPEDYHIIKEYDHQYAEGIIKQHKTEYRIKKKDGTYIWVMDRGMLISKTSFGIPKTIIGTHTDITDLKLVELSLEQSEKQLRSLSDNMPGVLYEYVFNENGESGFKFIGKTIEKVLGLCAEEFLDFKKSVHPDDQNRLLEAVKHTNLTNEPFNFEGRLIVPNRGIVWYSTSSSFSYDDGNGSRVFTGLMIDITEKKLAQERLEKQRMFYEQVLNSIPSDIAVFDHEHRYLFINPIAIKDNELRQWMIGKKDEDYCQYKNKPFSIVEGRRKIFNQVIESKKLVAWEETLTAANGSKEFHFRNMYPVINSLGNVEMVIGYGVNITDRKRIEDQVRINEKRYRDLFNYSQALICTHDQNGVLLSVNPSICETLGYTAEELIGRPLMSFIPERENDNFRAYYLDIVMKEGKSKGVFRALHKNGKKLFLLYQNYLVEEEGLEPYVIGFSQDITERIHAENELLLAKQITENVSKAKEIFLANMSHEIRTPMNGILGVANLLAKTEMGEAQKNYLKLIKESANNLLVIVNDVLDIEKITSGKFEFEQIPFRFADKLNSSIQSFQYKAEEKGIQLNYFSQLEEPLILLGDPYRLIQILNNLLNNAIKFTARGKVTVNIFSSMRDEENIVVEFTVQDTGIGIDGSKLETIFEPFVQASTDTTRKFGGTGLGLSICKNLIEMQGGSISVESKYGEGTVFHFKLPYKIGATDMLAQEDQAPEDYSLIGEKRILIAEDVELNQFIARQILESWGMEVAVAANGKIAVEMVQKQHFDLILMDIQMPEMDGIEATEIIRKLDDPKLAKIPIIALTANALKGDNHLYFQAGMNDYITKPYTEEKLYSVLSKFLPANPLATLPKVEVNKPASRILVEEDHELLTSQTGDGLLYDLTMVRQIGKGNPDFIGKMVALFLDQLPNDIVKLKEYADKDEWEALSKLAHRMKPSIEGMGIHSLKTIIRELETRSRNNESIRDVEMKKLVAFTCETMEKVLIQLRIEFPK
ncbi:MAG: hypothetical protein CFE25_11100 [Chitinophagaceae bacterium BSSC1]|nr:MAG: hypothetical protein CFE25_11100 [Chitinophagaceae bacterium BSSC1]